MTTIIDGEYKVTTLPNGTVIREINSAPPEPPAPSTKLTQLAFKKRFPPAKWKAARTASATNEDLADFFEDFDLATYIDVARDDTIAQVSAMALPAWPSEYRLTQAEVDTVLLAPVEDIEAWRG